MQQGSDLDQKEILQASMNDRHNPNDSLMNTTSEKACQILFVKLSVCTKSINQSIKSSPSYNFQNLCQIPQLI
jgi:hypothetical protein